MDLSLTAWRWVSEDPVPICGAACVGKLVSEATAVEGGGTGERWMPPPPRTTLPPCYNPPTTTMTTASIATNTTPWSYGANGEKGSRWHLGPAATAATTTTTSIQFRKRRPPPPPPPREEPRRSGGERNLPCLAAAALKEEAAALKEAATAPANFWVLTRRERASEGPVYHVVDGSSGHGGGDNDDYNHLSAG